MLKNYFKIAIRNLFKHKTFSTINILGLAIGIAVFLLIVLWIQNEFQYDQFHGNIDRLYKVWENQKYSDGNILTVPATPGPLQKAMEEEVPEVSISVRTTWRVDKQFKRNTTIAIEKGRYADDGFFSTIFLPIYRRRPKNGIGGTGETLLFPKTWRINIFRMKMLWGNYWKLLGTKLIQFLA